MTIEQTNSIYAGGDYVYYLPPEQRVFEGATTGYRLEQRGLLSGEPDSLAARELLLLHLRSDHAVRNNGYAATAKRKNLINLDAIAVRWVDPKGKENKKMQNIWDEFADDPNLDGFGNLDVTQLAWNASCWQSGEAFCRMLIKKRPDHVVPLVLQNLPPEYLDPTYNGTDPTVTRNGISFKNGRPIFYHFNKQANNVGFPYYFTSKDSNSIGITNSFIKVDVPADELIHIFEREKVGQWRGIPRLASLLLSLFELDDLTDAMVSKQKSSQAISWIIKNTNPVAATAIGNAISTYDPNEIDPSTGQRKIITKTNGGAVQYLNRNEDISQLQGVGLGSEVIDLIKLELHKIAQAAGTTYEDLTGDIQQASFSSLQQLAINKRIEAEFTYKFILIPLGLQKLCSRFQQLAMLYGAKNIADLRPRFQFPRKHGVNDLKDAQADVLEIGSHIELLTHVLAERGITVEELKADLDLQKELETTYGISFSTTDPKPVQSKPGMGQAINIQPNDNTKG